MQAQHRALELTVLAVGFTDACEVKTMFHLTGWSFRTALTRSVARPRSLLLSASEVMKARPSRFARLSKP